MENASHRKKRPRISALEWLIIYKLDTPENRAAVKAHPKQKELSRALSKLDIPHGSLIEDIPAIIVHPRPYDLYWALFFFLRRASTNCYDGDCYELMYTPENRCLIASHPNIEHLSMALDCIDYYAFDLLIPPNLIAADFYTRTWNDKSKLIPPLTQSILDRYTYSVAIAHPDLCAAWLVHLIKIKQEIKREVRLQFNDFKEINLPFPIDKGLYLALKTALEKIRSPHARLAYALLLENRIVSTKQNRQKYFVQLDFQLEPILKKALADHPFEEKWFPHVRQLVFQNDTHSIFSKKVIDTLISSYCADNSSTATLDKAGTEIIKRVESAAKDIADLRIPKVTEERLYKAAWAYVAAAQEPSLKAFAQFALWEMRAMFTQVFKSINDLFQMSPFKELTACLPEDHEKSTCRWLLSRVNRADLTRLQQALKSGQPETIRVCLEYMRYAKEQDWLSKWEYEELLVGFNSLGWQEARHTPLKLVLLSGQPESVRIYLDEVRYAKEQDWLSDQVYKHMLIRFDRLGLTSSQHLISDQAETVQMYLEEIHYVKEQNWLSGDRYKFLFMHTDQAGCTPLHDILISGQLESTRFYLEEMHYAKEQGWLSDQEYKRLLTDPNQEGFTPLHLAANSNNPDVCKYFVAVLKEASKEDQSISLAELLRNKNKGFIPKCDVKKENSKQINSFLRRKRQQYKIQDHHSNSGTYQNIQRGRSSAHWQAQRQNTFFVRNEPSQAGDKQSASTQCPYKARY